MRGVGVGCFTVLHLDHDGPRGNNAGFRPRRNLCAAAGAAPQTNPFVSIHEFCFMLSQMFSMCAFLEWKFSILLTCSAFSLLCTVHPCCALVAFWEVRGVCSCFLQLTDARDIAVFSPFAYQEWLLFPNATFTVLQALPYLQAPTIFGLGGFLGHTLPPHTDMIVLQQTETPAIGRFIPNLSPQRKGQQIEGNITCTCVVC